MKFRHIKQLIHLVLIPLIKSCPQDTWDLWVEKLLLPLFMHCKQALSCSWSNLLQEGIAKVPDAHGVGAGSELKVEVMEEKLLRDLTREISSLVSIIASPGLNVGLPSFEPSGHAIRVDESSLKNLDTFASAYMVGFVLKHKALAVSVLQTCLEVFRWTDGLTLESNVVISADLVGLCREIFIYLYERDPAPRQILLSLPHITACDLTAFEEEFMSIMPHQKKLKKRLAPFAYEQAAIPIVVGQKTKLETFVGADKTYTIEAMMGDRKALQARTSHNLGQKFSRAFESLFTDEGKICGRHHGLLAAMVALDEKLVLLHNTGENMAEASKIPSIPLGSLN
ncbi:hypothetical protein ACFE04_028863 [Oxalis oulophora]